MGATIFPPQRRCLEEVEARDRLEPPGVVEGRRVEHCVEGYRQLRRGAHNPIEAAKNLAGGATQSAMLELQIDRIEIFKLAADLLDMTIGKAAHAAVRGAQQKSRRRKPRSSARPASSTVPATITRYERSSQCGT